MVISDDALIKRFKYVNGTLKNKYHETDAAKLRFIEYKVVNQRLVWLLNHHDQLTIQSFSELVKIHQFLFTPIYAWAGEVRDYELSKGDTDFMLSPAIAKGIDHVNHLLAQINKQTKPTAMDYAQLLDSLNYLHPFREGNGRATKAFIQLLAANHGQELRFNRQDESVIRALAAADLAVLADFIQLKPVGSKQAVIQKISAELEKKGQHYQTYRPPVNGQF